MLYHNNEEDLVNNFQEKYKNKLCINVVNMKKFHSRKYNPKIDEIRRKIIISQAKDIIELWFLIESLNFLKMIQYWFGFFENYKIKLHLCTMDQGTETICKQIALILNQGISLGRLKSYLRGHFCYCFYDFSHTSLSDSSGSSKIK